MQDSRTQRQKERLWRENIDFLRRRNIKMTAASQEKMKKKPEKGNNIFKVVAFNPELLLHRSIFQK